MRRLPLDVSNPGGATRLRRLAIILVVGFLIQLVLTGILWATYQLLEPSRRLEQEARAMKTLEAAVLPLLQVVDPVRLRPYERSDRWLAEGTVRNRSSHTVAQVRLLGIFRDGTGREVGRGEEVVPPLLSLSPGRETGFRLLCDRAGRPTRCEVRVVAVTPLPSVPGHEGGG